MPTALLIAFVLLSLLFIVYYLRRGEKGWALVEALELVADVLFFWRR